MQIGDSSLAGLVRLRNGVRRERISSYDRTGGNRDWFTLDSHQSVEIARINGGGCIRHIWMTLGTSAEAYARRVVLPPGGTANLRRASNAPLAISSVSVTASSRTSGRFHCK